MLFWNVLAVTFLKVPLHSGVQCPLIASVSIREHIVTSNVSLHHSCCSACRSSKSLLCAEAVLAKRRWFEHNFISVHSSQFCFPKNNSTSMRSKYLVLPGHPLYKGCTKVLSRLYSKWGNVLKYIWPYEVKIAWRNDGRKLYDIMSGITYRWFHFSQVWVCVGWWWNVVFVSVRPYWLLCKYSACRIHDTLHGFLAFFWLNPSSGRSQAPRPRAEFRKHIYSGILSVVLTKSSICSENAANWRSSSSSLNFTLQDFDLDTENTTRALRLT